MKKLLILLMLLTTAASLNEVFGQKINMPLDSVRSLLCKKWVFDYVLLGNEKVGASPGAAVMNFEFGKDGSVLVTTNSPGQDAKGTWTYDAAKRLIRMTINKQSRSTITSLKRNELIMSIDTKDATPDDPAPVTMVYKTAASL